MFKVNYKPIQIKKKTYFNQQFLVDQTKKRKILEDRFSINPKLIIYHTQNPLKKTYDLFQIQREQNVEKLEKSILWKYNFHFKKLKVNFIYPVIILSVFLIMLKNILIQKHMLQIKKKKHIRFADLQQSGYLEGWTDELKVKKKSDKILHFQLNFQKLEQAQNQQFFNKKQLQFHKNIPKEDDLQKIYQKVFDKQKKQQKL